MPDQKLLKSILAAIANHLSRGVLPVHNGHLIDLEGEGDVMDCLLLMKEQGLISGDVVTRGENSVPFRMTNLRLTYLGMKMLKTY